MNGFKYRGGEGVRGAKFPGESCVRDPRFAVDSRKIPLAIPASFDY